MGVSFEPELPEQVPGPDVSDALGADAAVAQATDPKAKPAHGPGGAHGHGHHGPFHTHCENCGTKLEGPWCHACGQHDFEFHRSFRHVFMEALEAFFHFDGNFFRSTTALILRPGWLTAQFNAGKRAAQMPPFRIYLFVAFVFFFVMHFVGDDGEHAGPLKLNLDGVSVEAHSESERLIWTELTRGFRSEDWRDPAKVGAAGERMRKHGEEVARRLEEARAGGQELTEAQMNEIVLAVLALEPAAQAAEGAVAPPAEGAAVAGSDEEIPEWVARIIERASDQEKLRKLVEKFFASVPKILLVCMPVFALLTRLLFRKNRDFVYLKHLVLALHFHTFLYLWTLVVMALAWVAALPGWGLEGWVELCGVLWVFAYVPWMLRRLFANGWPKTLVKTFLLTGAYSFALLTAFSTAALLIFVL
jgi:hypothetical protein